MKNAIFLRISDKHPYANPLLLNQRLQIMSLQLPSIQWNAAKVIDSEFDKTTSGSSRLFGLVEKEKAKHNKTKKQTLWTRVTGLASDFFPSQGTLEWNYLPDNIKSITDKILFFSNPRLMPTCRQPLWTRNCLNMSGFYLPLSPSCLSHVRHFFVGIIFFKKPTRNRLTYK